MVLTRHAHSLHEAVVMDGEAEALEQTVLDLKDSQGIYEGKWEL